MRASKIRNYPNEISFESHRQHESPRKMLQVLQFQNPSTADGH